MSNELLKTLTRLAVDHGVKSKATTVRGLTKALTAAGVLVPEDRGVPTILAGDYALWVGGNVSWFMDAATDEGSRRTFDARYVRAESDYSPSSTTLQVHANDAAGDSDLIHVDVGQLLVDVHAVELTTKNRARLAVARTAAENRKLLDTFEHFDYVDGLVHLFTTGELPQRRVELITLSERKRDAMLNQARSGAAYFAKCDPTLPCPTADEVNPFRLVNGIYHHVGRLKLFVCRAIRRVVADAVRANPLEDAEMVSVTLTHFMLTSFLAMLRDDVEAYVNRGKPVDDLQEVALDEVASFIYAELSNVDAEVCRRAAVARVDRKLAELQRDLNALAAKVNGEFTFTSSGSDFGSPRAILEELMTPNDFGVLEYWCKL